MAGQADIYAPRASTPDISLKPQGESSAAFDALGKFGEKAVDIGTAWQHASDVSDRARATSHYLKGLSDLEDRAAQDADFRNAPKAYDEAHAKLRGEAAAMVRDQGQRAQFDLTADRMMVSSRASVVAGARAKEGQAQIANLNTLDTQFLQRLAKSKTDAERETIHTEREAQWDAAVRAGWIRADSAQARNATFRSTSQQAEVMRAIEADPAAARKMIEDPSKFPNLDPVTRQNLSQQAQAANDTRQGLAIIDQAKRNPVAASAVLGRVTDKSLIPPIVDGALIGQESGGNADAQSPRGAQGLTQFMPATARAVAAQHGIAAFDGMSDAQIGAKLRAEPALARQLAVRHLGDLVDKFDGRLAPAFAAYHAGEGNGQKYHKLALEQFGANYTPQQFASLIPASLNDGHKKTSDYVLDLFRRLGAPNSAQLSPNAWYRTSTALQAEIESQAAERKRTIAAMASLGRSSDDVVDLLKGGYSIDAGRLAEYKQQQSTAALAGDAAAARELRRVESAERIAPVVRGAFAMNPAELEKLVTQEDARMMTAQNVTAFDKERFDALKAVAETVKKAAKANPVGLAERAGLYRSVSIDPEAAPTDPKFIDALRYRSAQSLAAAKEYGTLLPFKPEEAEALKKRWGGLAGNAEGQLEFMGALRQSMAPRVFEAAMGQIGAGDGNAMMAARVFERAPDVAAKIIRGSAMLELQGVKPKAEEVRTAMTKTLGASVYPPDVQKSVIDAATALYVAERNGRSVLFDPGDAGALGEAIGKVGGTLARWNGVRVPLAQGMNAAAFTQAMNNLDAQDLEKFGGAHDGNMQPLDARQVGRNAILRPMGLADGRYAVFLPGARGLDAPVMTKDGQPLVIDLPAIASQRRSEGRDVRQRRAGYTNDMLLEDRGRALAAGGGE